MKVAISYTKTSDEHLKKILLLTEKLALNGVDFTIDYYDLKIGDDLYFFMEKLVFSPEHEYILVICNQSYKERADNYKGGVGFEARNLRGLSAVPTNNKVIPVVFEQDKEGHAIKPNFLYASTHIDLTHDKDFSSKAFFELISYLQGVERIKPNVNPINDFQNFLNPDYEKLSHFNNIKNILKRKSILSKRSQRVVLDIAKSFEYNKFNDSSIVKPILIRCESGEGKTTIVSEFAFKFGLQFLGTFYIDCNFSIQNQFLDFSSTHYFDIKVPDEIHEEEEIAKFKIEGVKNHINTNPVLLIFDNLETLNPIEEFLPKSGKSRAIVLTNNLAIQSPYFEEIKIPKLSDEEAFEILFLGCTLRSENIETAKEIVTFLGHLPFALELANSFLIDSKDMPFTFFFNNLKKESIKWTELQRKDGINFIHSSPTIIALNDKKFRKLKEDDEIDRLVKIVLSGIGCLGVANDELKFEEIQKGMGISKDKDEDLFMFNKIKNRLLQLGIDSDSEKFIVHTLTMEYIKYFLIEKSILQGYTHHSLQEINKMVNLQRQLHTFFIGSGMLNGSKSLINHLNYLFPPNNTNDSNIIIRFILALFDGFYFYGKDDDCLEIIELGLLIDDKDKDFEFKEKRKSDLLYHKAIALHRLEHYNDALEIYKILYSEFPPPSPFDFINTLIYAGDIYRYKKDRENALKVYNHAMIMCDENEKYFSVVEFLTQKIIVMMHLGYLYNEHNINNNYNENQTELSKLLDKLLLNAPKEVQELDSIEKYPLEIFQQMLQGDTFKPLHLALKVRTVVRE